MADGHVPGEQPAQHPSQLVLRPPARALGTPGDDPVRAEFVGHYAEQVALLARLLGLDPEPDVPPAG